MNRNTLLADILAGLTGAIIVLPQGIAYALIAGLPAEYGLYTAIVTPVIAGLFGSSKHLISGPTAAISIVVLSVISSAVEVGSNAFIPAVLILTLLVGVIQFGLGLVRMGTLVNFISHTVVIGFTAGAAILIATSQMKHALGISIPSGSSFVESWLAIVSQLGLANIYALTIALVTIVSAILVKYVNPKIPAILVGMVVGSIVCWLIDGPANGVAIVGTLPGILPNFAVPDISYGLVVELLPGAFAVAILGLVEAVSIARAIAIRSGQDIDSNQEFVGQGLSNIFGSFFSCYAGSGSFTRSGVNYDSGAQTPMAGIFAALVLIIILLFVPGITSFLPLPAMAGAILLIAWGLIDRHHIKDILRSGKQEGSILLLTFIATLVVELEFAIYLGVIYSLFLYLRRTSTPRIMEVAPRDTKHGTDLRSIQRFDLKECPQLKIIRIDGSVFFGAVNHIQKSLQKICSGRSGSSHVLIKATGINFIDLSGVEMLAQEAKRLKSTGGSLSFCNLKNTVKDELAAQGSMVQLVDCRFYDTVDDAIHSYMTEFNQAICNNCGERVFMQCPK